MENVKIRKDLCTNGGTIMEKFAVITGAGSGLGRELALQLSKQYHTLLLGRNQDKLSLVKDEIVRSNGRASFYPVDLRSKEQIELVIKELQQFPIDLVIHNAGVGHFGPFLSSSLEQLHDMFSTNVFGTIQLSKGLIPILLEQKHPTMINIISTAGLRGKKHEALYAASKFAFRGFAESLQKEFEDQVHIVNTYMGGMDTPFWDNSTHITDRSRLRSPKEVAEIILSQYMNRQEIIIESKK